MTIVVKSTKEEEIKARYYVASGYQEIDKPLQNYYGTMPFQETTMFLFASVLGITFGQSDEVRRAIGKKKKDVLENLKKDWLDACIKKNIPSDVAEDYWHRIEANAAYQFNESHAVGYSVTTLQTIWYKYHFPVEFAVTRLNLKPDEANTWLQDLVLKHNVAITPPDINLSNNEYQYDKTTKRVLMPLDSVKGISNVGNIINARPFFSAFDVDNVVKLNKRQKLNLYLLGSLNGLQDLDEWLKKLPYDISEDKSGITITDTSSKKDQKKEFYKSKQHLIYKLLGDTVLPTKRMVQDMKKYSTQGYSIGVVTDMRQGLSSRGKTRYEYIINKEKYPTFYSLTQDLNEGDLVAFKVNDYKYLDTAIIL